jgi:hypothetical protein
MFQRILLVSLLVAFGFSCSNTGNTETSGTDSTTGVQKSEPVNSLPDISGMYKLPDGGCKLTLTIKNENNVFKYNFIGEHLDLEGIAIVNMVNGDFYVVFDGPIGNTPPKTVEALYKDNTLTIQNSGNAQNQYQYFECSEKYLEFKKN